MADRRSPIVLKQGSDREDVRLPGPASAGLGRLRKVAIVGNAPTWIYAPWHDASWEIWSHTSTKSLVKRVDRFFELHPKQFWNRPEGKKWDPEYVAWLKYNRVPILMQERYRDVPASVRYPKERILSEFRPYFTSQTAWMIALALTEGVTHLGFFGVHYGHYTEYATQRAGCEYWMGVAEGRGVQIVLPPTNPLLREPARLYGYESHSEGSLHESYRVTPQQKAATVANVITTLAPDAPPPAVRLRDIGEPIAWERSGYPKDLWKE